MDYIFDLDEVQFNHFINDYLPSFEAIYGHNYLLMDKTFLVYVKQGYDAEKDTFIRAAIYTDYQPLLNKIIEDKEFNVVIDNGFISSDFLTTENIWRPIFGKNNLNNDPGF